jgi:hypothetical protein
MVKRVYFAMANSSALVLVAALCVRLIRHWRTTTGDFHFWVVGLTLVFALEWVFLLREKNSTLSLASAALVLFAAEGSIFH